MVTLPLQPTLRFVDNGNVREVHFSSLSEVVVSEALLMFGQYVSLMGARMGQDIAPQLVALVQSFHEVVPMSTLVDLGPEDLELLMSGLKSIDFDDWRAHTQLLGAFNDSYARHARRVLGWFWEWVGSLDQPQRARFLRFVTGSSGVPVGGFASLLGNDGKSCRFTLQPVDGNLLPRAHTCFNRLDLPLFESAGALKRLLTEVISTDFEGIGFGMN